MFTAIPHIINIDLSRERNMNQPIIIKKNDSNSHLFKINILQNCVPYPLEDSTAKIYFKKPDKNKVFSDCIIDDAINGKISYLLKTQEVSFAGVVSAEVIVYGSTGQILTTVTFTFVVSDNIMDDAAIESLSEFKALTNALLKVDSWGSQFNDKYAGLEAEYASDLTEVKSGLAHMATQDEVRLKVEKLKLEDVDADFLGAIDGSGTFDLLSIPQDLSVTGKKTNFMYKGKNSLDESAITPSSYLNASGVPTSITSAYSTTDFTPIIEGQSLTLTGLGNTGYNSAYYNSSKQFISSFILGNNASQTIVGVAGCAYVKSTINTARIGIKLLQVELGTVATSYEAFAYRLNENSLPVATVSMIKKTDYDTNYLKNVGNTVDILPNLFDYVNGYTLGLMNKTNGTISTGTTEKIYKIVVDSNTAYSFDTDVNVYRAEFDINDKCIVNPLAVNNFTFTTNANTAYVLLVLDATIIDGTFVNRTFSKGNILYPNLKLPYGKKFKEIYINNFIKLTSGKNIIPNVNYLINTKFTNSKLDYKTSYANVVSAIFSINPSRSYVVTSLYTLVIMLCDLNYNVVRIVSLATNGILITTINEVNARVQWASIDCINNVQLEEGTFKTVLEPYTPSLDIPLSESRVLEKIPAMSNDFKIPHTFYLLKGQKNTIYLRNLMRRYRPYDYYLRFTSLTNWDDRAFITPTVDFISKLDMVNADFDVIKSDTINFKVGDKTKDTGALNVCFVGDSFTDMETYPLRVKTICPNVNLVGSRYKSTLDGYTEGQSGWTLTQFINTIHSPSEWAGFSPFIQPIDPYKYYGCTRAWIEAYTGSGYNTTLTHYGDIKGVNHTTGYLTSPTINDVIYDYSLALYKVWNGSAWVTIDLTTLSFTININKYRSVWNVPNINIFAVQLGTNDYSRLDPITTIGDSGIHNVETSASKLNISFGSQLDTIYSSYRADNTSGKFMIIIPNSCRAGMKNVKGTFTDYINAMMYEERKFLVEKYDGRQAEGIYLVDGGSCIDSQFGFDDDHVLPFAQYYGTETLAIKHDDTHPNTMGFNQLGDVIAGAIQYIR